MSLAPEDPATGMVAVVRGYYRRARWKRWAIVLLSVIAVAAFLVTIVVGPVDITLPQLLRALSIPPRWMLRPEWCCGNCAFRRR